MKNLISNSSQHFLKENLVYDGNKLKEIVSQFSDALVRSGILGSYHREKTSGDMQAKDFTNDLAHKLLSGIQDWVQTVNNKGNWENQSDMIKEVICNGCKQGCDYARIPEVKMGAIRCPHCNRVMDQEGNVYGG